MKSSVTKTFRKRLNDLPASVQEQAAKAYALWQEDPYYPSLQFKRVSQRQPIYSVRVSLNYRVLGLLESDHIGLAHMMSMMNCLIGCRRLDRD
jgi:mRNA-degrading endonuclease RelE of RelBE toxin-antitoxin system